MSGEVQLGELLQYIEVGTAVPAQAQSPTNDEWGVLRLGALTTGRFVPEQAKRLPSWGAGYAKLEVSANDVLMVRVNGAKSLVGAAHVVKHVRPRLILSDLMFRLVPDRARLNPNFLGLLLGSEGVRRQIHGAMRGTSGQFQLPQSEVKRLKVPYIPLVAQHRVVAAHAAIERRITALERVSTKLRTVEVALVEQSLAGAQDCVPLESWLYRIETGKSPAAENVPAGEGEWGVLKVSAVQSGWFEARENKVVRDAGLINPHYEVQTGDLLMTRANTEDLVGLACVVQSAPPRLMLSDKTLRLVTNESMAESSFIQMALASPGVRNQIKAEATGTSGSMKNISQAAIRRLLVPNVAIQEQQRVTAAVASSRMRMDSVRRQIAKLRAVRQGLLDDLLSGRARVPQG